MCFGFVFVLFGFSKIVNVFFKPASKKKRMQGKLQRFKQQKQKQKTLGLERCSVVRSAYCCSTKGPGLRYQHLHWVALWPRTLTSSPHLYGHLNINTNRLNIFKHFFFSSTDTSDWAYSSVGEHLLALERLWIWFPYYTYGGGDHINDNIWILSIPNSKQVSNKK